MRFIFSFLALTAWFFPKLRGKRAQGKQPVRENNRDLPQPNPKSANSFHDFRDLAFFTGIRVDRYFCFAAFLVGIAFSSDPSPFR